MEPAKVKATIFFHPLSLKWVRKKVSMDDTAAPYEIYHTSALFLRIVFVEKVGIIATLWVKLILF